MPVLMTPSCRHGCVTPKYPWNQAAALILRQRASSPRKTILSVRVRSWLTQGRKDMARRSRNQRGLGKFMSPQSSGRPLVRRALQSS